MQDLPQRLDLKHVWNIPSHKLLQTNVCTPNSRKNAIVFQPLCKLTRVKLTPDPGTFEKSRYTPPISIAMLLQMSAVVLAESSVFTSNLYHDTAPTRTAILIAEMLGARDQGHNPRHLDEAGSWSTSSTWDKKTRTVSRSRINPGRLSLKVLENPNLLNKEVRPFFLSDNSIWSLPSVSSLSDYSIWRSWGLF